MDSRHKFSTLVSKGTSLAREGLGYVNKQISDSMATAGSLLPSLSLVDDNAALQMRRGASAEFDGTYRNASPLRGILVFYAFQKPFCPTCMQNVDSVEELALFDSPGSHSEMHEGSYGDATRPSRLTRHEEGRRNYVRSPVTNNAFCIPLNVPKRGVTVQMIKTFIPRGIQRDNECLWLRFKMAIGDESVGDYVWVDMERDSDFVPLYQNEIHMKILRMPYSVAIESRGRKRLFASLMLRRHQSEYSETFPFGSDAESHPSSYRAAQQDGQQPSAALSSTPCLPNVSSDRGADIKFDPPRYTEHGRASSNSGVHLRHKPSSNHQYRHHQYPSSGVSSKKIEYTANEIEALAFHSGKNDFHYETIHKSVHHNIVPDRQRNRKNKHHLMTGGKRTSPRYMHHGDPRHSYTRRSTSSKDLSSTAHCSTSPVNSRSDDAVSDCSVQSRVSNKYLSRGGDAHDLLSEGPVAITASATWRHDCSHSRATDRVDPFTSGASPFDTQSTELPSRETLVRNREAEVNRTVRQTFLEHYDRRKKEEENIRAKLEASETLKDVLDKWSLNVDGSYKDVRALLSTLHEVLWEDENWTPTSLASLMVNAAEVKKTYRQALLICHPDKQKNAPPDQQYRADTIFQALNESFRIAGSTGAIKLSPT